MSGFATRLLGVRSVEVPAKPTDQDLCACLYRCEYLERVFVGETEYASDKSSFLFKKIAEDDTVTLKLVRHDTGEVLATISDNTYGQYYATFGVQPNYVGLILDWQAVYDAFGYGYYRLDADLNIVGSAYTVKSRTFLLNAFSEELAHDTVKLVSYQFGTLVNSPFDFKGLLERGWPTYYRIPGTFGNMQVELESDRYYDSNYNLTQNRDKIVRRYTLSSRMISDELYHHLASNEVLANYHEISSYDVFAKQQYRGLQVVVDSVSDAEYLGNGMVLAEITFKDRTENNIKRNV